jgi:uncharacterized protein YjbJ (UPF0337 family)
MDARMIRRLAAGRTRIVNIELTAGDGRIVQTRRSKPVSVTKYLGTSWPRSPLSRHTDIGEENMDKDRIEGAAREAKGKVKETFGKVTGDTKTEAEGKAEKVAGKVQNAVGGAKDALRDATRND